MDELELVAEGTPLVLHPLWLRDHCRCPRCIDRVNGQRLHAPGGWLSPQRRQALVVADSEHDERADLNVTWADGHTSRYASAWLARVAPRRRATASPGPWSAPPRQPPRPGSPGAQREGLPAAERWREPPARGLARHSFEDVCADEGAQRQALAELARDGAILLEGCGTAEGRVLTIAARMAGHVRETLYGRSWRVEAVPQAVNVAYTSIGLDLHQDLLYYESPPGVQLLHCLRFDDAVEGGLSTLGDGLALAEELRANAPHAHRWLRAIEFTYHYVTGGHHVQYRRPIFEAGGAALSWAWPWLAPLRLWADEVEPVYQALHAWHELSAREDRRLTYRLRPGEMLIFDNRRMLHGRTAFDQTDREPTRVLEGAYVDWDGVASRYRALGQTVKVGR